MKEIGTPHADFADRAAAALAADPRFLGLLAGGSYIGNQIDKYSDLDLVLVVRDADYGAVMTQRREFAAALGRLQYAFIGEHVGEPRLLICLYAEPLLHVDLKFVILKDLDRLIETPVVLWERDGRVAERIAGGAPRWPNAAPEWFEERFWVWIHYLATKFGRGELFETIGGLSDIRSYVLGPMIARRRGAEQRGVRRIETVAPELAPRLSPTLGANSRAECARAIRETIELYRELRADSPPRNRNVDGETVVVEFVEATIARALAAPLSRPQKKKAKRKKTSRKR
ncbi:MAG TPA: hypothetical protein VEU51_00410 [Candidatus Acidoferrales bacterium]|nr:hypothetical protein [Candidatus Acidoferrales bacterium]